MDYNYPIPERSDLRGWLELIDHAIHEASLQSLLSVHEALHATFGDEPSDAVVEGERRFSARLQAHGFAHRHSDELSRVAGTLVEDPAPPTIEEVSLFLPPMPVFSGAISLVQDVEVPSGVSLKVNSMLIPAELHHAILSRINQHMPHGVELTLLEDRAPGGFARVMPAYDLTLMPFYGPVEVLPWSELVSQAPQQVLKDGRVEISPRLVETRPNRFKNTVLKQAIGKYEHFVLGAALIPNEEDGQGHIYSEEEVWYACNWWAANNPSFAIQHVLLGGKEVGKDEIIMLQNFTLPTACYVGEGERRAKYPKGTWFVGAGLTDGPAWREFASGKLNSWSIGAEAFVTEESV